MKENYLLTFLKGILMGLANAIPGVSGGTIAFITSIYKRLIDGIKNISVFFNELTLKLLGKNSRSYKKIFDFIDFKFFVPLLIGVLPAIWLFSNIFSRLMETYNGFIFSFFVGLIIASAVLIYKKIKNVNLIGFIYGLLGLVIGVLITVLPVSNGASPSIILIFFIGAIASATMLLPGVSGAFVVLLFGQLEFMYDVVANFIQKWPYLIAFGLGSITGLLLLARFLSYLLKKYYSYTLFFLTGIMIGSIYGPGKIMFSQNNNPIILLIFVLIGIGIVFLIHLLSKKK